MVYKVQPTCGAPNRPIRGTSKARGVGGEFTKYVSDIILHPIIWGISVNGVVESGHSYLYAY